MMRQDRRHQNQEQDEGDENSMEASHRQQQVLDQNQREAVYTTALIHVKGV
jgi:hypothetical protein